MLTTQFCKDFSFSNIDSRLVEALKSIKRVLFPFEKVVEECSKYGYFVNQYDLVFHKVVGYGKLDKEPNEELEDLRHLYFK